MVDADDPAHPGLQRRRNLAGQEPLVSLVSLIAHNFVPPASLVFRRSAHDGGPLRRGASRPRGLGVPAPAGRAGPVGFLPTSGWPRGTSRGDRAQRARAAELLVRDQLLRRDLRQGRRRTEGLGVLLALGDQLSVAGWGRAHQDHLDAVTTAQRIELGRVRGEMLLMRELLTDCRRTSRSSATSSRTRWGARRHRRLTARPGAGSPSLRWSTPDGARCRSAGPLAGSQGAPRPAPGRSGRASRRLLPVLRPEGQVDDYVLHTLGHLRPHAEQVFVVSNTAAGRSERARLETVADSVWQRENVGFDVWAYKEAMERFGAERLAELRRGRC